MVLLEPSFKRRSCESHRFTSLLHIMVIDSSERNRYAYVSRDSPHNWQMRVIMKLSQFVSSNWLWACDCFWCQGDVTSNRCAVTIVHIYYICQLYHFLLNTENFCNGKLEFLCLFKFWHYRVIHVFQNCSKNSFSHFTYNINIHNT